MRITRNVLTAIVILFLFASVMAGLYLIFGQMESAEKAKLYLETAKSLLQLGVIIILGGLAASMLKSFEKEKVNAKAIHDFHEEFLIELRENYESIKKSRRELRASGLTTTQSPITLSKPQVKDYRENMLILSEKQLKLERLKLEIENFPGAFKDSRTLLTQLSQMAKYIHAIHKEFEESWSKLRTDPANVPFSDLKKLIDFTGEYASSEFKNDLAMPYDKALALIRQELLPFKVAKGRL